MGQIADLVKHNLYVYSLSRASEMPGLEGSMIDWSTVICS